MRAKHCIIWMRFLLKLSSSSFESDLEQSFFWAKSANSQRSRRTMTVSSLSLPKRKPSQTMQEWIKKPNKYPNYPKSQTLKSFRYKYNKFNCFACLSCWGPSAVSYSCFFSCRYGLSLLLLCSHICCSILNCS